MSIISESLMQRVYGSTDHSETALEKLRALVEEQPEIVRVQDVLGNQPLHRWVVHATPEALSYAQLWVNAGANINARGASGETPLHRAAAEGVLAGLQWLHANDADWTLTNRATTRCDEVVPLALAIQGKRPTTYSFGGHVPHANERPALVRWLLAQPDIKATLPALQAQSLACNSFVWSNDQQGVLRGKALVEEVWAAYPELTPEERASALVSLALRHEHGRLRGFLELGVDPNAAKDERGASVLQLMAECLGQNINFWNWKKSTELLLEFGAQWTTTDLEGNSAASVARRWMATRAPSEQEWLQAVMASETLGLEMEQAQKDPDSAPSRERRLRL